MIIQGTNKPILIDFEQDMSWLKAIEIGLYSRDKQLLKKWDEHTVIINKNVIECPQTQQETVEYALGSCEILVKWLNLEGFTEFAEKIQDKVIPWTDKTILEIEEEEKQ